MLNLQSNGISAIQVKLAQLAQNKSNKQLLYIQYVVCCELIPMLYVKPSKKNLIQRTPKVMFLTRIEKECRNVCEYTWPIRSHREPQYLVLLRALIMASAKTHFTVNGPSGAIFAIDSKQSKDNVWQTISNKVSWYFFINVYLLNNI